MKSNNDKFCSLVYLIEDFCHTFDMLIYELSTFLLLNEFESQTIVYVNINKIYYENLHINNQELIRFLQSKEYHINEYQLSNGWTNEAIRKS